MGSDYPFPLGEVTGSAPGVYPGVHLDNVGFLSPVEKRNIFAGNALDLLSLKLADYARLPKPDTSLRL